MKSHFSFQTLSDYTFCKFPCATFQFTYFPLNPYPFCDRKLLRSYCFPKKHCKFVTLSLESATCMWPITLSHCPISSCASSSVLSRRDERCGANLFTSGYLVQRSVIQELLTYRKKLSSLFGVKSKWWQVPEKLEMFVIHDLLAWGNTQSNDKCIRTQVTKYLAKGQKPYTYNLK